jgi:hypothetical protein
VEVIQLLEAEGNDKQAFEVGPVER